MSGSLRVSGLRASQAWKQETKDQLDLGTTISRFTSAWRGSSTAVKDYTTEQVVVDAKNVSAAIKTKLGQTATLRDQLDATLRDVSTEVSQLVALRTKVEERLSIVRKKIEVNAVRSQVRVSRPARERTMDDVEQDLRTQHGELTSFDQRCQRSVAHINKALSDLELCRQRLTADLLDKQHALQVDTAVLHMPVDNALRVGKKQAASLHTTGSSTGEAGRTPQTWVRSTNENIYFANKTIADSVRLRKAVNITMSNSRAMDHKVAAALDRSMLNKLRGIQAMRREVSSQLETVRGEQTSMEAQRNALAVALEAKLGPLEQAQARLKLRKARTTRETVQDDVETALIREIMNLNAAIQSLTSQVAAADKHLDKIAATIRVLEVNLEEKDANLRIDESAVMMDGRVDLQTRPASSMASFAMSGVSTARTATMRRIAELENSIGHARSQRLGLQASYQDLRSKLQERPRTSPY